MLILGIDPGLATTGYGVVRASRHDLVSLDYGVIRTPAHTPMAERLLILHDALAQVIAAYQPSTAAVELLFFATNARTAMSVSHARGVVLLALARAAVPVAEYTPLQVKQVVSGYGQADKPQVQQMVRMLLGLDELPRPDDAADALAVAICHHASTRLEAAVLAQEEP
jgi:crossover junction endodeoxyribonuclease RuvC